MTWIRQVKNGSETSREFINTLLGKNVQGCFASAVRYGVGTAKAEFDPAVAHEITRFDELILPPFLDITARTSDWLETWNKQVGR